MSGVGGGSGSGGRQGSGSEARVRESNRLLILELEETRRRLAAATGASMQLSKHMYIRYIARSWSWKRRGGGWPRRRVPLCIDEIILYQCTILELEETRRRLAAATSALYIYQSILLLDTLHERKETGRRLAAATGAAMRL